jgi:hypothetical protein
MDHKSINSDAIYKFETDPRLRKYLETFCQLRLFATPFLKNSFAMISLHRGIRTLFLDHISDHKSINSGQIYKFETDPRLRKYLKTSDCSQRHSLKIRLRGYYSTVASGLNFWTTYWTTSHSILVQFTNLRQIQDQNTSKLSANSNCLQPIP